MEDPDEKQTLQPKKVQFYRGLDRGSLLQGTQS